MIICDQAYMAELRRIEKAERSRLSHADWIGIDTEIGLLWERPNEVLFRQPVAVLAFNIPAHLARARIQRGSNSFQGNMPTDGRYALGTWFDWATVNKESRQFKPWQDPCDLVAAFKLAHAIVRYRNNKLQRALDRRSLVNVNETVRTQQHLSD